MPSTTVHFPPQLLERIDAVAQRQGVSRNRFVIRACQDAVARDAGEWPENFFASIRIPRSWPRCAKPAQRWNSASAQPAAVEEQRCCDCRQPHPLQHDGGGVDEVIQRAPTNGI